MFVKYVFYKYKKGEGKKEEKNIKGSHLHDHQIVS